MANTSPASSPPAPTYVYDRDTLAKPGTGPTTFRVLWLPSGSSLKKSVPTVVPLSDRRSSAFRRS